jgi:hypothetical protein
LRVLFPAKSGYRITCPDWDGNYSNEHGVDFKVFYYNKLFLVIECKNWRQRTLKYGSDIAQTEVVNRFEHVGTNLKILIIPFADVFYNPALNLIRSNGIGILETKKLIGHRDYKSQLFYKVKSAITKLIKQHRTQYNNKPRPVRCSTNTNTLTNYCRSVSSRTLNNYIPNSKELSERGLNEEDKAILEELSRPVKPLINDWLACC